jgi:hypothetical protein
VMSAHCNYRGRSSGMLPGEDRRSTTVRGIHSVAFCCTRNDSLLNGTSRDEK